MKINAENECFLKSSQNASHVTLMYSKLFQIHAKVIQNDAEDAQSHPKMIPKCPQSDPNPLEKRWKSVYSAHLGRKRRPDDASLTKKSAKRRQSDEKVSQKTPK